MPRSRPTQTLTAIAPIQKLANGLDRLIMLRMQRLLLL